MQRYEMQSGAHWVYCNIKAFDMFSALADEMQVEVRPSPNKVMEESWSIEA